MIHQIVFSVLYPIHDDERTKDDIHNEFMLMFEDRELFKKEDLFQTHDNCWFVKSELTSHELYDLLKPNQNINVLITTTHYHISGHTYTSFWKWMKELPKK